MIRLKYLLLPFILFSLSALAKEVKIPYLSFQISERWTCQKEDAFAYTCRLQSNQPVRDAIIIISAKEAGPEDNFESFQKYLGVPKTIQSPSGTPKISKPQYVRPIKIMNQPWVDGVHLNSEIDGYVTRYLTTVKEKLAILVTLSAEQSRWKFFENDFKMVTQTIQLTNDQTILKQPYTLGQPVPNPAQSGQANSATAANPIGQGLPTPQNQPNYLLMIIAGLVVAGLFYYALKK